MFLSQNFLINQGLISKLIAKSLITNDDLVIEIGAGTGIITSELAKVAKEIIALEIDPQFSDALTQIPNVTFILGDFLNFQLPHSRYKVFANIPYSITGDIIRKLLQSPNPPADCYLIVQAEAADKFVIHSEANTLAALLYYPWWDIQITHRFQKSDFRPVPKVNSVLLHLQPRPNPLLSTKQLNAWYDFVTYHFVHNRQAKFIPISTWLSDFKHTDPHIYSDAYAKLTRQQSKLTKIHRTRQV